MSETFFIDKCIVSNQSLLLYSEFIGHKKHSSYNEKSKINLSDSSVKGVLSKLSKKRIKNITNTWIDALIVKKYVSNKNQSWFNNQITFCTLTLPSLQLENDREIKRKMFNYFFIDMKRKQNASTNLWVAEKQDNNNIHFHILYNKYIDYLVIRSSWNNILRINGYVDEYRKNQIEFHKNGFQLRENLVKNWSAENQYKAYLKGVSENWNNPNSTDIHKIEKIKNVGSYITKYLTKGNEQQKIDGKIWACSKNLQQLKKCNLYVDSNLSNYIDYEKNKQNSNVKELEHCTIINNISIKKLKDISKSAYKEFLEINKYNYNMIYNN